MAPEKPVVELGAPQSPPFANNGAAASTFGLMPAPAAAMAVLFGQSDPSQAFVKHIPAWELYTNNSQSAVNASARCQNACTLIRKDDPQGSKKG